MNNSNTNNNEHYQMMFDHDDLMMDPFNDVEAMTEMSNPKQVGSEDNREMEQYVGNMT
jgi:hypothetical protein